MFRLLGICNAQYGDYRTNADPDPAIQFIADPDPPVHFIAYILILLPI
jgi:hypothetical protein